ncbi:MAG: hypothetical protein R3E89_10175 [Thiolinea sp.]
MDTQTKRLWLALILTLLFLLLNAISTVQGWSPFAPIAQEHIRSASELETIRGQGNTEPSVANTPVSAKPAATRQTAPTRSAVPATQQQPVTTPAVPSRERTAVLLPPTPPPPLTPPQAPTAPIPPVYQMVYPDGRVQQFTYPTR